MMFFFSDKCTEAKCLAAGTARCAINGNKQAVCQCKAGFAGVKCQIGKLHTFFCCQIYSKNIILLDLCKQKNCLNGGICKINANKQPYCTCNANFEGPRCETSHKKI